MSKVMLAVFAGGLVISVFGMHEKATPESQGVESGAILKWIDACEKSFDGKDQGALHGFVIARHGKIIAEGSWKPFDTLNRPHMLYSHSKSFTSTAIGFLVDDGKIDLDELVADILPDLVPENPYDNIRTIRVRDLLTMNVGMSEWHPQSRKEAEEPWEKAFMANANVTAKPGQKFSYNSMATYMLSVIVQRKTGKNMHEFLKERLFAPLGIRTAWTTYSSTGIPCGGWGYNMTTRELAKFGQLYLDRGMWNGKRILSEEWVALASSRQTWSGPIAITKEDGSDWHQGYGFQFWRCRHGAFRADGAAGQLTVVLPKEDMVISVHAGLGNMQQELNLIWDNVLPGVKDGVIPENAEASAALEKRCVGLSLAPIAGKSEGIDDYLGEYEVEPNKRAFKAVKLYREDGKLMAKIAANSWTAPFAVGYGKWEEGATWIDSEKYEILGGYIGSHRTMSSAAVQDDGSLKCRVYLVNDTGLIDLTFRKVDGTRIVEGNFTGMRGTKFKGAEMKGAVEPKNVPPLFTSKSWDERRKDILEAFTVNEFGRRPVERPADLSFRTEKDVDILGGRAIRRTVTISCTGPRAPFSFTAHAYIPKGAKKVSSFVAINLAQRAKKENFDPLADDPSISSMPVSEIISNGFAVVSMINTDIAADDYKTCFDTGVFKAFGPSADERKPDDWGALSAWAWGASRVVDWIETQNDFDFSRIGVVGHSRGGKTSLWAGVTDSRFALACVNDAGCGGSKLNHMNLPWSENYYVIRKTFPHWFALNFKEWAWDETVIEYDNHQLIALVAPRKVAIGSGTLDQWAGPEGERAAALLAAPAWELYGVKGWGEGVRHHYREGVHNLLSYDWQQYMKAL